MIDYSNTGRYINYKTDYPPLLLWNKWCNICKCYTYHNTGGCTKHNSFKNGLIIKEDKK